MHDRAWLVNLLLREVSDLNSEAANDEALSVELRPSNDMYADYLVGRARWKRHLAAEKYHEAQAKEAKGDNPKSH